MRSQPARRRCQVQNPPWPTFTDTAQTTPRVDGGRALIVVADDVRSDPCRPTLSKPAVPEPTGCACSPPPAAPPAPRAARPARAPPPPRGGPAAPPPPPPAAPRPPPPQHPLDGH